jgi:hypothetical protein
MRRRWKAMVVALFVLIGFGAIVASLRQGPDPLAGLNKFSPKVQRTYIGAPSYVWQREYKFAGHSRELLTFLKPYALDGYYAFGNGWRATYDERERLLTVYEVKEPSWIEIQWHEVLVKIGVRKSDRTWSAETK